MFLGFILVFFLAFNNGSRAKLKGLSGIAWGLYTLVAFFVAYIFGMVFVTMAFCRSAFDIAAASSQDPVVKRHAAEQLANALQSNDLHLITIEMFGIGGFLLIRYLIDTRPSRKKPEIPGENELLG